MEVRNDIVVRWAVVAFGIFVMLMAAVTVMSDPLSTKHKAVSGSSYIGLLTANPIELAAIQDCLCFVPNPSHTLDSLGWYYLCSFSFSRLAFV